MLSTADADPQPRARLTSRMGSMLCLGFASGLPLALSGSTLQAWLTVEGVDIGTIGLFALVGLPYTLKFLWSPFVDRYALPILGRRRGWMLLAQLLLVCAIALMAVQSPADRIAALALLAIVIAFLSASQDIAVDAYRTDLLRAKERGLGAAVFVSGYRVAMLVSGAVALIIAERAGWRGTYSLMAALMLVGIFATIFSAEPRQTAPAPPDLVTAVVEPLRDFFSKNGAALFLLLIVLYKLGDALAGTLTTTFLLRELHFTIAEVGIINKGLGFGATLAGVLLGGALMTRLRLYPALLAFGILQALTNLGFYALAIAGKSYVGMAMVVGLENLAGGMGTSAFTALLMTLCNARYSATQFALLSALASVGRVLIGSNAGYLVSAVGWGDFFLITFVVALPGLVLLGVLRSTVDALDSSPDQSAVTARCA